MQERTATKRLFDDLFSERLAIETGVGRILSWERLDERRASRIVDYREVRDLANIDEQCSAAAWAAVRLRPHVLRDVGTISTSTTVLGAPASLPVLVGPVAYQRLAHPDGELATATGAAAA